MFAFMDTLRRAQADALGAFGFGPRECDYRVLASTPRWKLREYSPCDRGPSLLIVAAPIKRPYIWDLAPPVSAVRHCLQHRLHVYLLEWVPASYDGENNGLDDYVDAIAECIAISAEAGAKPILMGHSLGGTLAAIAAGLQPESIQRLVLLGAPLCFKSSTSRFRDAIAAMDPSTLCEMKVVPGSFLSQVSAMASPETFIWSRLRDAVDNMANPSAMDILARVEHWALDEAPLPGNLVYQIFQWLYREDRFYRGTLPVRDRAIGPSCVRVPTLATVNTADQIAPRASVAPFLESIPTSDVRLIEHPSEPGIGLQHLGILAGRQAHARVWPEIVAWLRSA
jgi:polyhydroxyalkanoate synthase subunit PhaC